jgi:hypothetical protein
VREVRLLSSGGSSVWAGENTNGPHLGVGEGGHEVLDPLGRLLPRTRGSLARGEGLGQERLLLVVLVDVGAAAAAAVVGRLGARVVGGLGGPGAGEVLLVLLDRRAAGALDHRGRGCGLVLVDVTLAPLGPAAVRLLRVVGRRGHAGHRDVGLLQVPLVAARRRRRRRRRRGDGGRRRGRAVPPALHVHLLLAMHAAGRRRRGRGHVVPEAALLLLHLRTRHVLSA